MRQLLVYILTTSLLADSFSQAKQNMPNHGQRHCNCKDDTTLNTFVICDTTIFKNNSMLYRQVNCDSSWLTFENKIGYKKIISSIDKSMIGYTYLLGLQFMSEFDKVLLFQNRQASGCCFPSPFLLLNKDNGEIVEELGNIIDYKDSVFNFVLRFSNDSLDSLTLYYIDSGKKYKFLIPDNRINQTMKQSGEMYPEFLFNNTAISNSEYSLKYKYQKPNDIDKWYEDIIVIDLNKYSQ